ncbi:MAG TPA: hypothetical protein VGE07_16295 [Herpetosiphonaceae bacterium]
MFDNGGFPSSPRAYQRQNELVELLKAWGGTTLAFAIVHWKLLGIAQALLIMAIAAGLGIVLHELAHRAVARRFGAQAHFMANDLMLIVSILMAFTGMLFAAPGAVWHSGYVTKRQVGLIAAAGPATNMALAVLSLLLMLVFRTAQWRLPFNIAAYSYLINALLGLFNMLPLGPIDGAKILDWDPKIFTAMAAVGGLIFALRYIFPGLFAFGF